MANTREILQNALTFLGRVELRGAEAYKFVEVIQWLQAQDPLNVSASPAANDDAPAN